MNSQGSRSSKASGKIVLPREFYQDSAVTLAPKLIGKVLCTDIGGKGVTKGIIVETEAYMGKADPAAHSFRASPDGRTNIMYKDGGCAYVYLIYGMHNCFNITVNNADSPEAVLIRALAPVEGIGTMQARRKTEDMKKLCSGPGKLCAALGITRAQYGANLCGDTVWLEETDLPTFTVDASKRIGIDYAGEAAEWLWRFTMNSSPYLSRK